jgi:hypothetical protein
VDALRAIGVINTHDLLKRFGDLHKDVACHFHGDSSREVCGPRTNVYSPSRQTDPKAHYSNYGCKTFGGGFAESMPLALAWASKRYRIKSWVVDPTNRSCRVPIVVRERALTAIAKIRA